MVKVIYSSREHETIIESYISMCKEFAKDVSTKTRYNNYLDVLGTIVEYHNSYGTGTRENNFYDWLVIIPINLSVATNGFFAGIETNRNRAVVRAYKTVLNEMVSEVVDRIDKLEQVDE
tara:strand:- start:87 stop:443 length:357 start_codon:yes stop_codon:yes gene_type:complete